MTVAELIVELQKMPPDVEVLTEGCDCSGDVYAVALRTESTYTPGIKGPTGERQFVYLERDNR